MTALAVTQSQSLRTWAWAKKGLAALFSAAAATPPSPAPTPPSRRAAKKAARMASGANGSAGGGTPTPPPPPSGPASTGGSSGSAPAPKMTWKELFGNPELCFYYAKQFGTLVLVAIGMVFLWVNAGNLTVSGNLDRRPDVMAHQERMECLKRRDADCGHMSASDSGPVLPVPSGERPITAPGSGPATMKFTDSCLMEKVGAQKVLAVLHNCAFYMRGNNLLVRDHILYREDGTKAYASTITTTEGVTAQEVSCADASPVGETFSPGAKNSIDFWAKDPEVRSPKNAKSVGNGNLKYGGACFMLQGTGTVMGIPKT